MSKRLASLSFPILFSIIFSFAVATTAFAEVVIVPLGQQAADKQDIERPRQGMTKSRVEAVFGKPNSRDDAVGEPPISRWIYDGFTVYFEYDRAIHSVLAHRRNN
ncbi:MAG: hypothetical protein ACI82Z_001036 [Cellvibrionaceae bacterium]|jgi:hypothetical protein